MARTTTSDRSYTSPTRTDTEPSDTALPWSLVGRVALVTGGGGGIGRATCVEMARAGADVVVVDLERQRVDETVSDVEELGRSVVGFVADVSDPAGIQEVVREAQARHGRVDVLFSNAGVEGVVAPFEEYPAAVFDHVMAVNARGVFVTMQAVLPLMLEQGRGSIVNNASSAGLVGAAGLSAYTMSKHAVIGLTRTIAIETAAKGVRVNAVCPGAIDTRMMRSIDSMRMPAAEETEVHAAVAARNPTGRYGLAREVARVVCFLASDAASFVTGAAWAIDGGATAQ